MSTIFAIVILAAGAIVELLGVWLFLTGRGGRRDS